MAGAWRGPNDGYGPGKTKRLIFMCTSPVFFQNAAWHWMLEIISQGKQFRANWGQGCRWSLTIARNITATSWKKRKLLASYFVFFASPVACADHFEDHSNIKQNNYLVDIVAWKLFQLISQGKLFQATRSQTRLITGSPETTNPFFFLPINTLDFLFSAQRSGSAQTPLRSPAVPARRQHDQVWRHQGGLYMRIDRSVTNAFCQKNIYSI